jgi:cytochrome c-type biogenesis protein CcmH
VTKKWIVRPIHGPKPDGLASLAKIRSRRIFPAFAGMTLVFGAIAAHAQEVETPKPPIELTPAQEAQYHALLPELRCLVCQNESLADSQASLAADLRYEVRGQVAKGQSDEQIKQYLTDRYSDFILYKPPLAARTVVLWFGPFVLLLGGLAVVVVYARRARPASSAPPPVDQDALKKILDEDSR